MAEAQVLNDIALKVGRLEVMQEANAKAINDMASSVNRLVDKLEQSDNIARDADQRARSAHRRLDDMAATQRWLIGTMITLGSLFIGAVTLVIKFIGA